MHSITRLVLAGSLLTLLACGSGTDGTPGAAGTAGTPGKDGTNAADQGTIAGTVKDAQGGPIAGVVVTTLPASVTATTDSAGAFSLAAVPIGSYGVVASKAGYANYTLPGVGVAGKATTNVTLTLTVDSTAPATVSGTVTDSKDVPGPIVGATVTVEGQSAKATTDSVGAFTLSGVAPGPVFIAVTPPDLAKFLPGETRDAVMVVPATTMAGIKVVLSSRQSDTATYEGIDVCTTCHGANNTKTGNMAGAVKSAAHNRSLTRIARVNGKASAGAWTRLLNPTLTAARTVMIPLAGSIAVPAGAVVTGTGTAFLTGGPGVALQVGDKLGYTPKGLAWTQLGVVQSVDSDTQVTLSAPAVFAPGVTSLPAATKYGVARLSNGGHTHMWPEDASDIVAPAWPGVKATNPNYDANDPLIYAASGAYADGQVNVYLCNLKGSTVQGVTYTEDDFVQKFGGNPYTCSDGTFWDGVTTPPVPMVHIDVIYGGQGDKDNAMAAHPNLGVFKQRFQGRMADVKTVSTWVPAYTSQADRDRDSLTLPIQILESGDKVNGGFKMNGYHPTEQKFPGESWTQRTRTFSHACAGCHNTGMTIAWDMTTATLPIPRDGTDFTLTNAAIKTYNYVDENITCEHCHGPGSEHVAAGGGRANKIINPKFLTAESERQTCGKCHGYDDATNAKPAQTYGFEYGWNSDWAAKIGGGEFVAGVFDLGDAFDNWTEQSGDDEAYWDPASTGGKLYGQAHRQQYTMLGFSVHGNNPYKKTTCTDCHDAHSTFRGTSKVQSKTSDKYDFANADFRNNVVCLSCHAGGGPLPFMKGGPFATLTKDDVAALHIAAGGTVKKNGVALAAPNAKDTNDAQQRIAMAVGQHMLDKAKMGNSTYNPTNEAMPTGRCTSCHMPKLAKSGGYTTGQDFMGNNALVEGDQASHVFDIVWPTTKALSRGGPSFQSGYYGQSFSATNVKYDAFGYMPNSCSKCHTGARQASLLCPDITTIWPAFWPINDPVADPNMSYLTNCFTSKTAP